MKWGAIYGSRPKRLNLRNTRNIKLRSEQREYSESQSETGTSFFRTSEIEVRISYLSHYFAPQEIRAGSIAPIKILLLQYHPFWPSHSKIAAGFPLTGLIEPIFSTVAQKFDHIKGESLYQEARYSIEFRAQNKPKSLEIRSAAELHWLCWMGTKKEINFTQRTIFPRVCVTALPGTPNTAYLCIG